MDTRFLEELFKEKDNSAGFISMYELGERLGMDRGESDAAGMQLITEGLAELVNLSGGIKISEKGITECTKLSGFSGTVETADNIGEGPFLSETAKRAVDKLIEEIKYTDVKTDEFRVDKETIITQFSSPKPKTAIIKVCFDAISAQLNDKTLKEKIEKFIS